MKRINAIVNKNIAVALLIIILVTIYTLPLLLNIDKGLTFEQKNCEGMWYLNYNSSHFYYSSITRNHKFPFWEYFFEGGIFSLSVPDEISFNPFSMLVLAFGIVKGMNLHYYLMYILGALSMFYLTRIVLKYNLFGSIYASLVFSMCSLFPLSQMRGFISARETILLPLLTALFLKSIYSNRYILPAALLLGFFFMQTALYFPVVVLFLFIFAILNSFSKNTGKFVVNKRYLVVFFTILISSLCLMAFKLFLVIEFIGVESGSSGLPYLQSVENAYTFSSLVNNFKTSVNSTIYVGCLPLILCFLSGIILFQRMKKWLMILLIFCTLSLGHNSFLDLHYFLWRLPIFNAIDELDKYYALIIVFSISLLAGSFFSIIEKRVSEIKGASLSFILIAFSFLNLLTVNYPYFNEYKTELVFKDGAGSFCHAKVINYQEGDDSGLPALALSLYLKGIGLINQRYDRHVQKLKNKDIVPKYFIMPEYVFLSPSTKLIISTNPVYKGETFFQNEKNKAKLLSIAQDKISIKLNLKSQDRLIINQNYSNWWQCKAGKVENNNGLLSIFLDKLGDYEVELYFFPINFYLGIGVSVLSMIFFVFLMFFSKHWQKKRYK